MFESKSSIEIENIIHRNEKSKNSRLGSIKKLLEIREENTMEERWKKSKLLRLISYNKYEEFQREIGMDEPDCDGKLGNSTLQCLHTFLSHLGKKTQIVEKTSGKIKKVLTENSDESYVTWTERAQNSKLSEIKELLEGKGRCGLSMEYKKRKLKNLIQSKKYKEFQKELGMNEENCDGKLGKGSLEQLRYYLEGKDFNIDHSALFLGVPIYQIQSCPSIKDEETGKLCCSRTARMNGLKFGLNLPRGNAHSAGKVPGHGCILSLPKDKKYSKPNSSWSALEKSDFLSLPKNINFMDFYTYSPSNYGHRAIGIRDGSGERYILDPYIKVNGKKNTQPKKLEDYLKKRKIVKVHFYKSQGYNSN